MLHHPLCPVIHAPQPTCRVLHQQRFNHLPHLGAEFGGEVNAALQDLFRSSGGVIGLERSASRVKLIQQNTKCPIIYRPIVSRPANELRRNVIWRPTESVCRPILQLLRQSHIHNHAVPLGIQHQVLRLEVAVRHALRVELRVCQDHACRVELHPLLGEATLFLQEVHELPPWEQLQQEVDVFRVLHCAVHDEDVGVLELSHEFHFIDDIDLLPVVDNESLALCLERVELPRVLGFDHLDLAESSLAKDVEGLQVLQLIGDLWD
mmetsp:Transcript_21427/g.45798  ORF Transcript_21427/g.45798 Transcript_21427/m.45798 type:complete len:264 (+) Transcript_21427:342-1133(+)